jgi:hypothetical protein
MGEQVVWDLSCDLGEESHQFTPKVLMAKLVSRGWGQPRKQAGKHVKQVWARKRRLTGSTKGKKFVVLEKKNPVSKGEKEKYQLQILRTGLHNVSPPQQGQNLKRRKGAKQREMVGEEDTEAPLFSHCQSAE